MARDLNEGGVSVGSSAEIAIADETTGQFLSASPKYSPDQVSFSSSGLDIQEPDASLSGPLNAMHLHAKMSSATIDLVLHAKGPVMYNGGTGLTPLLGGMNDEYALPNVATTGTLVDKGRSYPVTGVSFADHQWGDFDFAHLQKWTYGEIRLSNGDSIVLSDISRTPGRMPRRP
jgi:predicted secreted hydrolase